MAAVLSLQLKMFFFFFFATASALWVIAASLGEVRVNKIRAQMARWESADTCSASLADLRQSLMSAHLHRNDS